MFYETDTALPVRQSQESKQTNLTLQRQNTLKSTQHNNSQAQGVQTTTIEQLFILQWQECFLNGKSTINAATVEARQKSDDYSQRC